MTFDRYRIVIDVEVSGTITGVELAGHDRHAGETHTAEWVPIRGADGTVSPTFALAFAEGAIESIGAGERNDPQLEVGR